MSILISHHISQACTVSYGLSIYIPYNHSSQHVMAMVLVKAKEVAANANGNVGIADAVMAVPHWFTDSQRKGMYLLSVQYIFFLLSVICHILYFSCPAVFLISLRVLSEGLIICLSY